MMFETKTRTEYDYERCSRNQHGDRYRRLPGRAVAVVNVSTDCTSCKDMRRLIVLSNQLDITINYDFDDSTASIDMMAG